VDRYGINEHRNKLFGSDGPVAFICECDDPYCLRVIRLSRAEYLERRAEGQPIVLPGHSHKPVSITA
jgi:hypothetical protein